MAQDRTGINASSFEHDNEVFSSIKGLELLDYSSDY